MFAAMTGERLRDLPAVAMLMIVSARAQMLEDHSLELLAQASELNDWVKHLTEHLNKPRV